MVGNSPKSDINPALAAGLHAVFVPHGNTWILEHEDLGTAPAKQRLLVVEHFSDLQIHF
jgi:putative hydrolase of the HAD superfamily